MLLRQTTSQRTILRLAMVCLLISSVLQFVAHPTSTFWMDAVDGVRGALIGAMIALVAVLGVRKRRDRSAELRNYN